MALEVIEHLRHELPATFISDVSEQGFQASGVRQVPEQFMGGWRIEEVAQGDIEPGQQGADLLAQNGGRSDILECGPGQIGHGTDQVAAIFRIVRVDPGQIFAIDPGYDPRHGQLRRPLLDVGRGRSLGAPLVPRKGRPGIVAL